MMGNNISSLSNHSSEHTTTLFCVPNAGGTVMMYKHWRPLLHPSINLRLLELAGRGRRFQERCHEDLSEAAEDLYSLIEQQLNKGDFAFFGHSMGAMLCYELINKIWAKRQLTPVHAFLSGRVPPNSQDIKILHHLSDARLMAEVKRWGGFSRQQLADKTLMRMFLPILRADMKMVETYSAADREYPRLPCSISILTGADDTVAQSHKMLSWTDFTTQSCSFHTFSGGHFYLTERTHELLDYINMTLSRP